MPGSNSNPPPLQILTVLELQVHTAQAGFRIVNVRNFKRDIYPTNISIPNINTKDRRRSWHKDANSIFEHPRSPMKIPLRLLSETWTSLAKGSNRTSLSKWISYTQLEVQDKGKLLTSSIQRVLWPSQRNKSSLPKKL
ncbi:hypothetical protein EDC94DRAFT_584334 [Helicostylum pulchrum]|nr:hypothetical protein EDC94DRAFT_584334 [Helicostylum pulchrum]